MVDFIGPAGELIPADSTRAQRAHEVQDRIDLIIHRESELGAFDLEAVRELGKFAN
jgi:hypothetical protein